MVTVLLKSCFRFNISNMPDSVFRHAAANVIEQNSEVMFDVVDLGRVNMIQTALQNHFHRPISYSVMSSGVIEFKFSENAVGPAPVETTPAPRVTMMERPNAQALGQGAHQDMQRAMDQIRAETPVAPARVCPECENVEDECDCEPCDDCNRIPMNCTCVQTGFRDITTQESSSERLRALFNKPRVDSANLVNLVASKLDNETAGKAKMISDKVIQYNRMMSNLIALQNEIERLGSAIGADPIVADLMAKVTELTSTPNNMVSEIYFNESHLVVKTKEIITNPLRDGRRRKIGEMLFFINLSSLLGTRGDAGDPILIKNCTRENVHKGMQCGHVYLDGHGCYGSWMQPIIEAMNHKDLNLLIELLIRFVRTPNEDDGMGRPIQQWPIVEDVVNETRAE